MSTATGVPSLVHGALQDLADRFAPEDIDVPGGEAVIRVEVSDGEDVDAVISLPDLRLEPVSGRRPDARVRADTATWEALAGDLEGGMAAFGQGRLSVRDNLHLGIGFLAATNGDPAPGRLRFHRVEAGDHEIAITEAGEGPPLICIHGLGGTKASFMTTLSLLAPLGHRVIAIDLPGFGDSSKPFTGGFDAIWYAEIIVSLMDELGLETASFAGNSMGGRIALEMGFSAPERVDRLVLLAPSLAWLKERPWKWLLQMPLPRLGYLQPTPRWAVEPVVRKLVPGGEQGWTAAGVDEFLRAYLTPSGRFAFYECARNIYLEEPYGGEGFWTRLKKLEPAGLFVWGDQDTLVPKSFMRHVERALPRSSAHLELDCGHVPQMERPIETHDAVHAFLTT
ncbi:MAG: alpha/beta fold hydrolase [Solirubrobacterales bacterium]|nr:alpha/beta fold hydrolase [Solirubrobacterales bacterium]MCB8971111.1 alpha/beta fold hydrolase [Thermoleophilales bacterium]MCO5327890.1 alpha/beta fold hydrolase [Solirubrobacterales bacterium]